MAALGGLSRRLGAGAGRAGWKRALSAAAEPEKHRGADRTWKILSFVVALPGVAICQLNCYLKKEEHHERPPFIPYKHLYIRTKSLLDLYEAQVECLQSAFEFGHSLGVMGTILFSITHMSMPSQRAMKMTIKQVDHSHSTDQ